MSRLKGDWQPKGRWGPNIEILQTRNILSPGQTNWQVVASGRKLTKQTRKSPRKYTQIAKKDILRQTILYFIG